MDIHGYPLSTSCYPWRRRLPSILCLCILFLKMDSGNIGITTQKLQDWPTLATFAQPDIVYFLYYA